jgi:hypothetical protein
LTGHGGEPPGEGVVSGENPGTVDAVGVPNELAANREAVTSDLHDHRIVQDVVTVPCSGIATGTEAGVLRRRDFGKLSEGDALQSNGTGVRW